MTGINEISDDSVVKRELQTTVTEICKFLTDPDINEESGSQNLRLYIRKLREIYKKIDGKWKIIFLQESWQPPVATGS
jgi:phage antirepressor YoqD-like protein